VGNCLYEQLAILGKTCDGIWRTVLSTQLVYYAVVDVECPTDARWMGCAYRKSNMTILVLQSAQDQTTNSAFRVFGGARYR
jgi:hypothetical protein